MKRKLESLTNFGLSKNESQQIKGGTLQTYCYRASLSRIVTQTFVGMYGDEHIGNDDSEDIEGYWT